MDREHHRQGECKALCQKQLSEPPHSYPGQSYGQHLLNIFLFEYIAHNECGLPAFTSGKNQMLIASSDAYAAILYR